MARRGSTGSSNPTQWLDADETMPKTKHSSKHAFCDSLSTKFAATSLNTVKAIKTDCDIFIYKHDEELQIYYHTNIFYINLNYETIDTLQCDKSKHVQQGRNNKSPLIITCNNLPLVKDSLVII